MMITEPQQCRSKKLKQIKSGVAEIGGRGRKQKKKTNQKKKNDIYIEAKKATEQKEKLEGEQKKREGTKDTTKNKR